MHAHVTAEKSFSRDIFFSALLHAAIVAAVLLSPMLLMKTQSQFIGEVIRVNLSSPTDLPGMQPKPIAAPVTPAPLAEEVVDIPLAKPVTVDKAVPIEKKEKPKPKPKKPTESTKPVEKPAGENKNVVAGTGSATGGAQVDSSLTGGEGSPFGGVTIDNASFNYPYWFTQAFAKIRGNMQNPVLYDGKLVCVIYFQVIRSGRVIKLEVAEPSGIKAFDDACVAAIERSKPFPPLPNDFRDEVIGIRIPFTNN